jgi:hypothetical protein
MQEEFIHGVRELLKATRPHVNYVKDFERRAENDPKGCAEEAQREIIDGTRRLQRIFKEAFGVDFEQAFKDTFYLTPDQRHAIRETAVLPSHPVACELFLLWLYWLHFHRLTLGFFLRCLQAPDRSREDRARDMCSCFIRHQQASWCTYLIVADDVAERFPEHTVQQALVEQFTAFFVAHTSLHRNKRLWKAINELKEQNETYFERLIKEVSGEVLAVWREKRTGWKGRYFQPSDLMEMRTEVVRRLEKRNSKPPIEAELAEFLSHEELQGLLKQGREAGLPPQEFELYKLLVTEPGLKNREYGTRLGISANHVSVLKTRIKKTLRPSG